ncbi:DNA polymerase III subunit delta [Robinsoniella peoriensis]|uniref:DNA polymerase III subunit delta n=1 Tax=Robinsoniella peoriensis TaxID=180332 RepID=UPI003631F095
MKSLLEDLNKGEFKKAYLLFGEETYLKNLYKNKLKDALIPEGDTMNVTSYEGKSIDVRSVIDQAETMPFFADKRFILIENSGFFKNANVQMAEYIPQIPESTCMVFVENEVDKRGKVYKAVKSAGRVVELGRQDEKTLTRWILGALKKEHRNITEATMHLFMEKTGTDMENIQRELEKLVCYTMGHDVITAEDVETICTTRTVNKIFDMINAIAEKRQKKALDLYYDLLALKEPPMRILFLITRQFNLLMQVKELRNQGFDTQALAPKIGLQSFIARNYVRQAESFTLDRLKEAVNDCVEAEEAVKTGQMNDVMSVELLIVKYSH